MKPIIHDQELEPCDPFIKLTKEIPEITQHVHNFQLTSVLESKLVSRKGVEGSIFVFRKKKLSFVPSIDLNFYSQPKHAFELENKNTSKSRFSCDRCRKYKKKCSRDLPECEYCVSSEEFCYYRPRKKKVRGQRNLAPATPSEQTTSSIVDMLVGAAGSTSSNSAKQNEHEPANKKSSSTIYKLLN